MVSQVKIQRFLREWSDAYKEPCKADISYSFFRADTELKGEIL
tara:strand:- start:172 stop:300 length:129 start_codon:yes stop_codon:yes gene_type:complete